MKHVLFMTDEELDELEHAEELHLVAPYGGEPILISVDDVLGELSMRGLALTYEEMYEALTLSLLKGTALVLLLIHLFI